MYRRALELRAVAERRPGTSRGSDRLRAIGGVPGPGAIMTSPAGRCQVAVTAPDTDFGEREALQSAERPGLPGNWARD
jgi:hypothetical protein